MNREQLRKLHEYEVSAMIEFDRICKKHGLRYYLAEGTLLGAVRHQGFIPWDDDVDIAMPRADYDRLMKIAQSELSPRFSLQNMHNEVEYENRFAKIRINNTAFVEEESVGLNRHQGIFIDIWPLDCTSDRFDHGRRLRKKLIITLGAKLRRISNRNHRNKKDPLKDRVIFALLSVFSRAALIRMVEWVMRGKGDCYINWGSAYGWKKHTIKISHYDPPVMLMFEGKEYPAPKDYDYWLRRIYGDDYMQLPPVEKRRTHNPVRLSFDTNGPDEVLE